MDSQLLELFVREIRLQCKFAQAAFQGLIDQITGQDKRREEVSKRSQYLIARHQSEQDELFNKMRIGDIPQSDVEILLAGLRAQQTEETREHYEDGGTWPVFYFSYSFLLHSAIISKLIWPGPTVHGRERRKVGEAKVDQLVELHQTRGLAVRTALRIDEDSNMMLQNTDIRDDLEHYDERLEAWYVSSERRNIVDLGLLPRSAIEGIEVQDFRRNIDPSNLNFYIEGNDFDLVSLRQEIQFIDDRARNWLRLNSTST